jgi:uncharacterized protein (DUF885 family)
MGNRIIFLSLEHMDIDIKKTEEIFREIKTNKYYPYLKRFTESTHVKGVYIEFYLNPLGNGGKNDRDIIIKFHKKILKSIVKMLRCQDKKIYHNKIIIDIMQTQIKKIIENRDYWLRYGFSETDVNDIFSIYLSYSNFLDSYKLRIPVYKSIVGLGKTRAGNKLYNFSIFNATSLKISANDLQKFGFIQLLKNIEDIEKESGMKYGELKIIQQQQGNPVETVQELKHLMEIKINELYNATKSRLKNKITFPTLTKIKIKEIPDIKAEWSSKAKAHDNIMYINTHKIGAYKRDNILRMCAHECIPGHIMERKASSAILDKLIISPDVKHMCYKGFTCIKEGWASYAEKLGLLYTNTNEKSDKISMLFNKILHSARIIVDTALNSGTVDVKFDLDQAREFLKKYTAINEDTINSEINKSLTNPGVQCSYGLGHHIIDLMEKLYFKKYNEKNIDDFVVWFLSTPVCIKDKFDLLNF